MRKWGWEEVGTVSCGKNGERQVQLCWLSITFNRPDDWAQSYHESKQESVNHWLFSNTQFSICVYVHICVYVQRSGWAYMKRPKVDVGNDPSSLFSYEMRENHFLTSKAHGSEGNKIINSALICVGAYMYREAQGQCQESFSIPLPPYSVRHWISQIQSMQITTLHASLL